MVQLRRRACLRTRFTAKTSADVCGRYMLTLLVVPTRLPNASVFPSRGHPTAQVLSTMASDCGSGDHQLTAANLAACSQISDSFGETQQPSQPVLSRMGSDCGSDKTFIDHTADGDNLEYSEDDVCDSTDRPSSYEARFYGGYRTVQRRAEAEDDARLADSRLSGWSRYPQHSEETLTELRMAALEEHGFVSTISLSTPPSRH